MGNTHHAHHKSDNSNSDSEYSSSDEDYAYDTLDRDFSYKRCSSGTKTPAECRASPSRSVSIKRTGSDRERKVARSVSARRRPSFKASTKRSLSRSSSQKNKQGNKLLIADMEIKVEDGKLAKLVPREGVLEKRGIVSDTAKPEIASNDAKKAFLKIEPVRICPPPKLGLTKKNSYGSAIANDDLLKQIVKLSNNVTKRNNLSKARSTAVGADHRLTQVERSLNSAVPSQVRVKSKSMYMNKNNNNRFDGINSDMDRLTITTAVTDV